MQSPMSLSLRVSNYLCYFEQPRSPTCQICMEPCKSVLSCGDTICESCLTRAWKNEAGLEVFKTMKCTLCYVPVAVVKCLGSRVERTLANVVKSIVALISLIQLVSKQVQDMIDPHSAAVENIQLRTAITQLQLSNAAKDRVIAAKDRQLAVMERELAAKERELAALSVGITQREAGPQFRPHTRRTFEAAHAEAMQIVNSLPRMRPTMTQALSRRGGRR